MISKIFSYVLVGFRNVGSATCSTVENGPHFAKYLPKLWNKWKFRCPGLFFASYRGTLRPEKQQAERFAFLARIETKEDWPVQSDVPADIPQGTYSVAT